MKIADEKIEEAKERERERIAERLKRQDRDMARAMDAAEQLALSINLDEFPYDNMEEAREVLKKVEALAIHTHTHLYALVRHIVALRGGLQ